LKARREAVRRRADRRRQQAPDALNVTDNAAVSARRTVSLSPYFRDETISTSLHPCTLIPAAKSEAKDRCGLRAPSRRGGLARRVGLAPTFARQSSGLRAGGLEPAGTPLISLGRALVANSLCRAQEKRTICETEVQIRNSGYRVRALFCAERSKLLVVETFLWVFRAYAQQRSSAQSTNAKGPMGKIPS
jgi:hypothetical protein